MVNDLSLRDRMLIQGAGALKDSELLAILIGSGPSGKTAHDVAIDLLGLAGDNLHELGKLLPEGYASISGIGSARASILTAAMEIGRRRTASMRPVTIQIVSSRDVFLRFVDRLSDLPHEEFWILLLRRSNHVLAEIKISSGGLAGTVADPKIIFGRALALRAAAIVLIHNHPSGNPKPSSSDKSLTNNMREAGKFLDLPVLDHIIVAGKQYVSFADEGLI
ncbi:MAG: DNA repair protein RadC [Bacteroidetes bacterium]|jgi:DNA repair protein RadC|nr:DNA repair protein RadC [Bacteroidota bacterium]